jgi:hypothetical protein
VVDNGAGIVAIRSWRGGRCAAWFTEKGRPDFGDDRQIGFSPPIAGMKPAVDGGGETRHHEAGR